MEKTKLTIALAVIATLTLGVFYYMRIQTKERAREDSASSPTTDSPPGAPPLTAEQIIEKKQELDRTVWAKEVDAQKHEELFIQFWDQLRRQTDKYAIFERFPLGELAIGTPGSPVSHEDQIVITPLSEAPQTFNAQTWPAFVQSWKAKGYRIIQTEWHHLKFDPDAAGGPHSTFTFNIHAVNAAGNERYNIGGRLEVEWGPPGKSGVFEPRKISTDKVTIAARAGAPAFVPFELPEARFAHNPGAMLVYDLNGDGLPEIVLVGLNLVYWNKGGGKFEAGPLLSEPMPEMMTGVFADFHGSGHIDLICAAKGQPPMLFSPDDHGKYTRPGVSIKGAPALASPSALTAGDYDGDGLQDLFIAQYKEPYVDGSAPTPYFDANDGHPAVLLKNKGNGEFADVTLEAGLGAKRNRRTYSTSLVDLQGKGHLDLLVVNDYSGIDVFYNDGHGKFTEATSTAVDERANFGMSHTFADFNLDGQLDFYVTGMSSTTARRLESMKLGRADFPEHNAMRPKMGFGNRMYVGNGAGTYRQPPFFEQVARSGWSWGCAAIDFDNDGDPDIFVANGNYSNATCRDYCSTFWTHDIYMGSSKPDKQLQLYFDTEFGARAEQGISFNPFEHKALFLNESGKNFMNVSFLMDLGFEYDARQVAAADLDLDGRADLAIIEKNNLGHYFELHVYRNNWAEANHWIGVRLKDQPGVPALGATVTVTGPAGKKIGCFVTGDSLYTQHPLQKHFGLGKQDKVEAVEVRWINGQTARLESPAVDQFYLMEPAKQK